MKVSRLFNGRQVLESDGCILSISYIDVTAMKHHIGMIVQDSCSCPLQRADLQAIRDFRVAVLM